MKKYYFFRIVREMNAQHEFRAVLHALPGQTTFVSWREPNGAVDPALKVQLRLDQNGLATRLPAQTVVGVLYEASRQNDLRLPVYTRGGVAFYRTEKDIKVVSCPRDCPDGALADPEMRTAYVVYLSSRQAENAAEDDDTVRNPDTAPAETAPAVQTVSEPSNEMNLIEDALRRSFDDERVVMTRLLAISRLRDRMRKGVARFTYVKQNGDVRHAYGTRNPAFMHGGQQEAGQRSVGNDGEHFCYFDIEKDAWRCFCVSDFENLVLEYCSTDPDEIRGIRERYLESA